MHYFLEYKKCYLFKRIGRQRPKWSIISYMNHKWAYIAEAQICFKRVHLTTKAYESAALRGRWSEAVALEAHPLLKTWNTQFRKLWRLQYKKMEGKKTPMWNIHTLPDCVVSARAIPAKHQHFIRLLVLRIQRKHKLPCSGHLEIQTKWHHNVLVCYITLLQSSLNQVIDYEVLLLLYEKQLVTSEDSD